MKRFIFIFLIILFTYAVIAKEAGSTGKIIVKIINIKNNNGNIRSQLYNDPRAFPTQSDKAFKKAIGIIRNEISMIVFDNLPMGDYAITVHHDEDLNGKMNKNVLGLPKEGWGISQNPVVIVKLPEFNKAKISLNSSVIEITIVMK